MNKLQTTPTNNKYNAINSSSESSNKYKLNVAKYAQITIQTNNKEVPYIAIYKPNIQYQQMLLSAAIGIEKNSRKSQLLRLSQTFNRLKELKHQEKHLQQKIYLLQSVFLKLAKTRIMRSFFKLRSSNVKKKNWLLGARIIASFQKNLTLRNIKHSFTQLRYNHYYKKIDQITPTQASAQLIALKNTLFTQNFVKQSKQLQKIFANQQFVNQIRDAKYRHQISLQKKRFESIRLKMGRRREWLDNEIVVFVLGKAIEAFESCLADQINHTNELTQELEQYKGVNCIEDSINELAKMDDEIKQQLNNKSHRQMITIISSQSQQILLRTKKCDAIAKILDSRLFWNSIVVDMLKQASDEEHINNQISQLISISSEQHRLMQFISALAEGSSIKLLAQAILKLYGKMSELQSEITYKEHSFVKNDSLSGISNIKYKSQNSFPNFERKPSQRQVNAVFCIDGKEGSLLSKFFSGLKECLQGCRLGQDIRHQILKYEQLIEGTMRGSQEEQQRIKRQNITLRTQNQYLAKVRKEYANLLCAHQQQTDQINKLKLANEQLNSTITHLSFQNSQLTQKLTIIKKSNAQLSERGISNLQQSVIGDKSSNRLKTGKDSNMMKQNDMMRQIITLKIEYQNLVMRHQREINSLNNTINQHRNTINDLELAIYQINTQKAQKTNHLGNLNTRDQVRQQRHKNKASIPLSPKSIYKNDESLNITNLLIRSSQSLAYSLDDPKEQSQIYVKMEELQWVIQLLHKYLVVINKLEVNSQQQIRIKQELCHLKQCPLTKITLLASLRHYYSSISYH